MKLWEKLKLNMNKNPAQTVGEGEVKMTYKEIIEFSEQFADKIRNKKCCAVYCNSEMMTSLGLLACFAAGVTAVPLSKKYGELHCRKILDLVDPDCMISDIQGKLEVYTFKNSKHKVARERPALIMCTSGTTGTPKGAMLSEENILTNLRDIGTYFKIDVSDKILIARPLYHCAVLTGEFLISLIKGVKVEFYSGAFNPITIIKTAHNKEITVLGATPTFLRMLIRFIKTNSSLKLKKIVVSGESLATATALEIRTAFPDADIYHVYGLTEASPRVCCLAPALFDECPDYVGLPLGSVTVKIMNVNGNEVAAGEKGVLWIKGGNVMEGYYNNPEYTSKVLRDGWLCTGDIAEKNREGLIKILGRSDDLIIRAGINIYPGEVESAMLSDSRTREILVHGERDADSAMRMIMEVSGDYKSVDEVRNVCKSVLSPHQMPDRIILVEAFERNGSGKVIRSKK